jgi:CTP:molybdopterin cytidylyltransferase MocA
VQLVMLAAGHGRRFGGLKQLAPIGPNGETLMDYTAREAEVCGYAGLIVVVREEIQHEIRAHAARSWPKLLPVEFVIQGATPGTAQAVASTRPVVDGPIGVVNADDYYGSDALQTLRDHFGRPHVASAEHHRKSGQPLDRSDAHLLVAYRLTNTVLNEGRVNRALCDVASDGRLRAVREHTMARREDGSFDAMPLNAVPSGQQAADSPAWTMQLTGQEAVSTNLWGFHPRLLDHLDCALQHFDAERAARPELLLPDVVGQLIDAGTDAVLVEQTDSRCLGVTYPGDVVTVRDEIARELAASSSSRLAKIS